MSATRVTAPFRDVAREQTLRVFLLTPTEPGIYSFTADQACSVTDVALQSAGPATSNRHLLIARNGAETGVNLRLAAGALAAVAAPVLSFVAGDTVRLRIVGYPGSAAQALLRLAGAQATHYRLQVSQPLPGRWRMQGGVWVPVKDEYRRTGSAWSAVTSTYRRKGTTWPFVAE